MLNKLGIMGLIIGLILFIVYIRFWMEVANYIGNIFLKIIKYTVNLFRNKS